jgi:hypothetical protein
VLGGDSNPPSLKGTARSETLHLFQNLSHGSIQVTRYLLLLVVGQGREGLAQVSIDDRLDRNIVTSVRQMVSAGQRNPESPHVLIGKRSTITISSTSRQLYLPRAIYHFQSGHEFDVILGLERNQGADGSADRGVYQNVLASGDEWHFGNSIAQS